MNERVPTYLRYDESTYTDISFTSSLDDTFYGSETTPKNLPSIHVTPPPPAPHRSNTILKRVIQGPVILTKRSVKLSTIWSQKAKKFSRIAFLQTKEFFAKKTNQIGNYLNRRKLEHELKSYGSFRTKKGFVEVGAEEKCMDQYDLDSHYESYAAGRYSTYY